MQQYFHASTNVHKFTRSNLSKAHVTCNNRDRATWAIVYSCNKK